MTRRRLVIGALALVVVAGCAIWYLSPDGQDFRAFRAVGSMDAVSSVDEVDGRAERNARVVLRKDAKAADIPPVAARMDEREVGGVIVLGVAEVFVDDARSDKNAELLVALSDLRGVDRVVIRTGETSIYPTGRTGAQQLQALDGAVSASTRDGTAIAYRQQILDDVSGSRIGPNIEAEAARALIARVTAAAEVTQADSVRLLAGYREPPTVKITSGAGPLDELWRAAGKALENLSINRLEIADPRENGLRIDGRLGSDPDRVLQIAAAAQAAGGKVTNASTDLDAFSVEAQDVENIDDVTKAVAGLPDRSLLSLRWIGTGGRGELIGSADDVIGVVPRAQSLAREGWRIDLRMATPGVRGRLTFDPADYDDPPPPMKTIRSLGWPGVVELRYVVAQTCGTVDRTRFAILTTATGKASDVDGPPCASAQADDQIRAQWDASR